MKSSEVSIKTRSTPASLTIQGQVTKDTTVKWSVTVRTAQSRVLFSFFVLNLLMLHFGNIIHGVHGSKPSPPF